MRLSEWRKNAPSKDAGGPKVAAVVDAVIDALGAERDPHCWVAWGEEPAIRYMILIPTEPGLITSFVRVSVPGEGPRATTKLIRWSRLSIGELTIETQAGHRLLSFQVEQQVLRGADAAADRVAAFALRVIAAIDGRSIAPNIERSGRGSRTARSAGARSGVSKSSTGVARSTTARTAATKSPATKSPATKSPATKSPATKSPATKSPAAKPPSKSAATSASARPAAAPARRAPAAASPARTAKGSGR
jgi:hypothetical protein